jgi:hypothetical protein
VIVDVNHGVQREAVSEFVRHCQSVPGPNTVILRLPTGDVRSSFTTGLTPADEPLVSVILGGARVHYDAASVDLAALGEGVVVL